MIRKLLMVGAAAAIPFGALAVGAIGGGVASAATLTCTESATITFASPGIDYAGYATSATSTTTNVSASTLGGGGCTGSGPALAIVSKNSKCAGVTPAVPGCSKTHKDYYDSAAGFASNAGSLAKEVKGLSLTVNGNTWAVKVKTSSAASTCPAGEVGFQLNGTVKSATSKLYKNIVVATCLLGDTGPGTTGNFLTDYGTALGGGTDQIQTATIDPGGSTITLS